MSPPALWWKSPLWQFALFVAALAVLQPVYLVAEFLRGRPPLMLADVLFRYAAPLVLLQWMVTDARQRRSTPCFDYGFFLLILWPISLFWYCCRTRGWRGLGLAVGLWLLTAVPALTTGIVTMIWAIADAVLNG
jgi:hypothetical protein